MTDDTGTLDPIGNSSTQHPTFTIGLPEGFDPSKKKPATGNITATVTGTGTPPHPSINEDSQPISWTTMITNSRGVEVHKLASGGTSGTNGTGLWSLYWNPSDAENLTLDVSYPDNADGSQKWGKTFAISGVGGGRPAAGEAGA